MDAAQDAKSSLLAPAGGSEDSAPRLHLDELRHNDSSGSFATETELGSGKVGGNTKAGKSGGVNYNSSVPVPEMIEEQEDDAE